MDKQNRESRAKEAKDLKYPEDFLNMKCVIYTLIIGSLYWFLPRTKVFILIATLLSFCSINWYNHMYICEYNDMMFNIIYALTAGVLLTYLPRKNKTILIFSLYFPYFLIAWYDYFANCTFRMNPTIFPFGRFIYLPVKPDPYKRRFDELDPVVKANISNFDKYLGFSLLVGGVGYLILKLI